MLGGAETAPLVARADNADHGSTAPWWPESAILAEAKSALGMRWHALYARASSAGSGAKAKAGLCPKWLPRVSWAIAAGLGTKVKAELGLRRPWYPVLVQQPAANA